MARLLGARHDPRVLTVLCSDAGTGGRVLVMDLHNADRIEAREGRCTIVNLTAKLISAEHLTIRSTTKGDGTERVLLSLSRGVIDMVPCYSTLAEHEHDGLAVVAGWNRELEPSEVIRINGKMMRADEAARRYPRLPKTE